MLNEQEIRNNPSLIMFNQDDVSEELKMVAIEMKPSLLEVLNIKTDKMVVKAFEGGHWSDTIISNLKKCTASKDSVAKFMRNATENIAEDFLNMYHDVLNEEASKQLLLRFPNLAGNACLTGSDDMDWEVINNTFYMDAKTVNPLLSMNITQDKVDALFAKVRKWAVLGIPQQFQTKEIKEIILKTNPYDFRFVAFDEDIARMFIKFPGNIVEYAMTEKKDDPYYELRVLHILNIMGEALKWVTKQTEEMQIAAVKNYPMALQFIKKPSDDLCLLALKANPNVVNIIENPSKAVCAYLGIPYVKPSKYDKDKMYLVTLKQGDVISYQRLRGDCVDAYLNKDAVGIGKLKKIANVKQISETEMAILEKFHIFTEENPFLREEKDTEDVEVSKKKSRKKKNAEEMEEVKAEEKA